jgi:hypothetical protein
MRTLKTQLATLRQKENTARGFLKAERIKDQFTIARVAKQCDSLKNSFLYPSPRHRADRLPDTKIHPLAFDTVQLITLNASTQLTP